MRLDEWREREKVTQGAFAEQVGTAQSFISEIERGLKVASDDLAAKIEEATNGAVTFLELKHPKYRKASND
ncbi:MAG: helix-turn-helix transcriptional regulator [Deltaproteobacteria bacterium]|nr:helix-turn-helix transcriptional regulator [Deltaproteobacteria bacterium]